MIKSLTTLALGLLLPVFAKGEDMVKFSVEKEVYQVMSSSQKQAILYKVSELNTFFKDKVIAKIPLSLQEKISGMQVTIFFTTQTSRDGLFVPGVNHKHKITVPFNQIGSNGLNALLAHEFFHAVHFELNPDVEPWIREGMAQLFEFITTGDLNAKNLKAAIDNPYTPLIGEYDIDEANSAQYGHNMLYFTYLYNHCGENNFFWSLTEGKGNEKDYSLIESTLATMNVPQEECKDFKSSALQFEIAKHHNQIQFSKEEERERYYVAPVNLVPKVFAPETAKELSVAIAELPLYSSMRVKLDTWKAMKGICKECTLVYARKSFPYEVSTSLSADKVTKNYDVIVVKTNSSPVLTEVSSKNIRNEYRN